MSSLTTTKSLPHKTGSALSPFIFIRKKYNLLNKTRKQLSAILKPRFAVICTLTFNRGTAVTEMGARIVAAINIHKCSCPWSKGGCMCWQHMASRGWIRVRLSSPALTDSEALGSAMLKSLIKEEQCVLGDFEVPWTRGRWNRSDMPYWCH